MRSRDVQEEPDQHERMEKIRVDVNSLALIRLADVRHLQDQMREIAARLGTTVVKIGRGRGKMDADSQ